MVKRDENNLDASSCQRLLESVRFGHLAGIAADGSPVVRTLHHALWNGDVYFHGSVKGEKNEMIGGRAVFEVVDFLTAIPSYWRDPRLACPATAYYRSVQVKGCLEAVTEPAEKAVALQALMRRCQPEGGHEPIAPEDPTYRRRLGGVAVFALRTDSVSGRIAVGQSLDESGFRRVLWNLWCRGARRDTETIECMLASRPASARPDWLRTESGHEIVLHPSGLFGGSGPDRESENVDTDPSAGLVADELSLRIRDRDDGTLAAVVRPPSKRTIQADSPENESRGFEDDPRVSYLLSRLPGRRRRPPANLEDVTNPPGGEPDWDHANFAFSTRCEGIDWKQVVQLFLDVGWEKRLANEVREAFSKSHSTWFCHHEGRIVGVARSADDGRFYAQIVDLAIHPDFQGRGLGTALLERTKRDTSDFAFVVLTAAPGKREFYVKNDWKPQESAFIWPRNEEQEKDHARQSDVGPVDG